MRRRTSAWRSTTSKPATLAGPAAACLEALRTRISHSVVCRHPRFELVLELAVALPPGVQPVEELAEAGDLGLDPCAQAGVVVQRLGQDLGAAFRRPAGPPFGAERRQPVLDPDDFEDLVEVEA